MHEGLLITTSTATSSSEAASANGIGNERSIIFCNRPVNKLFTDYLDQPLLVLDSLKDSNSKKNDSNG